jgi:hypothetical protein
MDSSSFTELSQRRPVHIPIVLIYEPAPCRRRTHELRITKGHDSTSYGLYQQQ